MPTIKKAGFLKRISAWLLDCILVVILTTGFAAAISQIVGYDKQSQLLESYYTKYEQIYGIDFDITQEDYDKLTPDEKTAYQDKLNQAEKALKEDAEVLAVYERIFSLTLVIVSFSVLLSTLAVYFVVPLFFKDGQTLGKKVFGLAVVRSNCVKISNFVLLSRTLFGLYAIETMFPIFLLVMIYFGMLGIVGTITIGLLLLLQIGVMIRSKTNSCIHDLLADTVVVEFSTQQIFESNEELQEFIKAEKAREAAEAAY